MGDVLRVRLIGPDAELGRIPAADVARLLQGVERAVAHAAERRVGRLARTGRRGASIEATTRLIFRGVESGSVAAVLEVPDLEVDTEGLDLDDAHLGEVATADTLDVLAGDYARAGAGDVAGALLQLADDLSIGTRYEALNFEYRHAGRTRSATLNVGARQRLAEVATAATADERQQLLRGTLVEADFENYTARLRMADGSGVTVSFDLDLADDVQRALRRPSELEGVVIFDRDRQVAKSVRLRSIVRGQQLAMGLEPADFWRNRTVEQLAAEQGTGVVDDMATLRDEDASDDEVAAILAALDLETDRSS